MRIAIVVLICMTFIVVLPVRSQDMSSLRQGVRIRIQEENGEKTVGNFLVMHGDSLRFAPGHQQERDLPISAVRNIDVSKGRSHGRGLLKGALIGAAAGIAGGALLGAAAYKDTSDPTIGCEDMLVCSRGVSAAVGAVFYGAVGVVLGSAYGAVKGSEVWAPAFTKSH